LTRQKNKARKSSNYEKDIFDSDSDSGGGSGCFDSPRGRSGFNRDSRSGFYLRLCGAGVLCALSGLRAARPGGGLSAAGVLRACARLLRSASGCFRTGTGDQIWLWLPCISAFLPPWTLVTGGGTE
jgi:hypothetical protein